MKKYPEIPFEPGDKVRFLNEKGAGVVVKVLNRHTVSVLIDEGFEIPYPVNQLVPIEKTKIKTVPSLSDEDITRLITLKESPASRQHISIKHAKNSGILEKEVDLHYGELSGQSYKKLTNGEIVSMQLDYFQRELDEAIRNNLMKITFIHGIGNGRLKTEIRKILETYDGLKYHDASYNRYGFGATEVILSHTVRAKH